MPKSEKFVAELKIEKIERTVSDDQRAKDQVHDRILDSVTRIVIKADSLERLVEKLTKHISIIEED